jgi:outer membrane protein assembly factor BamB
VSVTRSLSALIAAACVGIGLAARASDWPQWRGPTGLSYCDETDLPLTWGGKNNENIVWKVDLPKSNNPYSSPIVWRGKVFITITRDKPVEHHVICYQASDGKLLWDTPVEPGPWILTDLRGGYGAPTPCTDGERVYAVFGSAVIAALDFNGKLVWRKPLARYDFDVAMGSSPILYKDTVILLCDQTKRNSSLIAYDGRTGQVKWEEMRPTVGFAHCTPILAKVNGADQMIIGASNALQGVDPTSGKLIWWCANSGDTSSPAFGAGITYCDSGRGNAGVAVDPTGKGDVTATHLKWKSPIIPEGLSSPIIVGDLLYRLHSPDVLRCFKAATGEQVYSQKLPGIDTRVSPIATPDGRLYFAGPGKSYVIKAGPQFEVLATSDLGDGNPASAAISNGRICLKGNRALYCIGKK